MTSRLTGYQDTDYYADPATGELLSINYGKHVCSVPLPNGMKQNCCFHPVRKNTAEKCCQCRRDSGGQLPHYYPKGIGGGQLS